MRDRPSKSSRHSPGTLGTCFLAHPTRLERVTVAFRALLLTPPQPLQRRCRRTANRLNEPHAPVAQLDRALPSEGKGHTFESCRVRHFRAKLRTFGPALWSPAITCSKVA